MGHKSMQIFVLFGLAMINCPNGVSMYLGNFLPYIYSFQYSVTGPRPGDLDLTWILGLFSISFSVGILVGALMQRKFSLRFTMAVGISLYVSGTALTYFTVQHTVWAMSFTFSFLGGIGNGMVSTISLQYAAGWFDHNVGTATATASAASGIGGILINQVITAYTNPDNLNPNVTKGEMAYFSQTQVVDRVPKAFLLTGAVMSGFQVFGFCFLRTRTSLTRDIEKDVSISNLSSLHNERCGSQTTLTNSDSGCKKERQSEMMAKEKQSLFQTEEKDFQPSEVLKSEKFYILFVSAFVLAFGQLLCSTNYKLFGQLWIADDKFLAGIGSGLSLCGVFFRLFCGYLVDGLGVKNALICHLVISCTLQSVWYFTATTNRWWYFVWTNVLFAVYNNVYVIYPIVVVKLFGKEHCSTNLFLINLGLVLAMLISPPLMNLVLDELGWFWLFFLSSCFAFCSLLLTVVRM